MGLKTKEKLVKYQWRQDILHKVLCIFGAKCLEKQVILKERNFIFQHKHCEKVVLLKIIPKS